MMTPETCTTSNTSGTDRDETANVALLPCPFCGSSSAPRLKLWDGDPPMPGFYVVCDAAGWDGMEGRGCGCSGAYGETKIEAVEAWNRRAAPTLPADVKGLVDRLNKGPAEKIVDRSRHGYNVIDVDYAATTALLTEAAAALTSQSALLDRAKQVMEPFVEVADRVHERTEDDRLLDVMTAGAQLTIGVFRAARAWKRAYSKSEG